MEGFLVNPLSFLHLASDTSLDVELIYSSQAQ